MAEKEKLTRCGTQIDVAVNAPEAGTITEFLVSEEDTVTVGQEIIKLETGGAPAEGAKKSSEPEASKQPTETKSEPKEESKPEPKQEPKKEPEAPKPAKEEKPQSKPAQTESKATETTSSGPNRGERRVCPG